MEGWVWELEDVFWCIQANGTRAFDFLVKSAYPSDKYR